MNVSRMISRLRMHIQHNLQRRLNNNSMNSSLSGTTTTALQGSTGAWCLNCLTMSLSCPFWFGRHVFGNRLGTKVPGDATSSIGLDTDARDLVLPD